MKKALEKRCQAAFAIKVLAAFGKKAKSFARNSATKFGHDAAFGKKARASSVSEAFGKKVPSTASLSSLWKKGSENFASLCKKGMDLEHFF